MASLIDRMIRASKLDINLYEEVEADKSSMGQAITVVVISRWKILPTVSREPMQRA